MITFLLISSLFNVAAAFALTFVVYSSTGSKHVRKRFLVFMLIITGWTLGYAMWQISSGEKAALLYTKTLIAFAAFIPAGFYHLTLTLSDKKVGPLAWLAYALAVASILTLPFGGLVGSVSLTDTYGYWPKAGPFLVLVIASFAIYVPLSSLVLIQGARSRIGIPASQMKFVLGSATVGFIGGLTNFPLWYDIPIPPYGNLTVFIYLLMVGYGVYNRRITGMSVDIFKVFIFILLSFSAALFYVLGLAFYVFFSGKDFEPNNYWIHGFAGFAISATLLWGVPKIKLWSERVLDVLLRKEHLSVVARLNNLPIALSNLTDEKEIHSSTTESLYEILEISGAALFNRGIFDSHYRCRTLAGEFENDISKLNVDLDEPLIRYLTQERSGIVVDQVFDEMPIAAEKSLVQLKEAFGIAVIIPIISGNDLYGFILLGPQNSSNNNWPDENLALLFSIGAQLGLNFKARELERKGNEVDKLVSLGTMAAGLAHEIRNPLVSIQTLAGLLAGGRSTESMSESFKSAVLRDVKRISSIVEGVAMFSENRTGPMRPVRIGDILDECRQIYRSNMEEQSVELELVGSLDLTTLGNFDQIAQVFNNLIDNAIQAMEGVKLPKIRIEVSEIRSRNSENWMEIKVSDTGPGVPETILERIFDPFMTSKDTGAHLEHRGMGLGLAITKRIIENHKGAISANNLINGGAVFIVSLKSSNSN